MTIASVPYILINHDTTGSIIKHSDFWYIRIKVFFNEIHLRTRENLHLGWPSLKGSTKVELRVRLTANTGDINPADQTSKCWKPHRRGVIQRAAASQ